MPDLLSTIETHLNTPHLRDNLTLLFCETLLWGRPQRQAFAREVRVRQQEKAQLAFTPVAQLSGLPVFRVDWPYDKPPNVTQRRAVHRALAPTYLEHLLAYVTDDDQQATFIWARRRPQNKIEMRALPYAVGSPARTTIEQLGELAFTVEELGLFGEPPVTAVTDKLNAAFDVEVVTRLFFTTYRDVFGEAEGQISGISGDARRLFTQKLFNRLMFLVFLERKGWLSFNGSRDHLRALWEDHKREKQTNPNANFYRDRLELLFFSGLNTPHEVNIVGIRRDGFLQTRIGDVPYLNGGLFEEDDEDRDPTIAVPDEVISPALDKLFYRFNFTVTESTPLDIEVAVDPEMLGVIFEELVTGRHETGSYYTPKPVVAFMGREALKGYLESICPQESSKALAAFVDEYDPVGLVNPEVVLDALKTIKVCDPACGSGAYLLGMLHELLDLRTCLFATRGLDPLTAYQRKLEIIQNNLYGVDSDVFAVNIARLRLWLSLMVDFEDGTPPPLPNLDFKIEVGDSLTAPDPSGGLQPDLFRHKQIEDYFRLKADYLMAHGGEKLTLREQIEALRAEIAAWARPSGGDGGFDWAVEFAEVFSPSPEGRQRGPGGEGGGFDVVLTNPPYVRQELLGCDYKENALEPVFHEVYSGIADLYVYFYARAHQLLRPGGVGCFISSNKWLRASYGEKLRQHLLDAQAFRLVVDFGELPVFQAATFPAIFLWHKQPRSDTPTTWAVVKDLEACYDEGIREHVTRIAQTLPASQFGKGKARLTAPAAAERRAKMEGSGPRLGELVKGQVHFGIKTALNKAFVVDRATRDRLITEDPRNEEILKPLLVGDNVRRYELHFREKYLIWTYIGVPIKRYPAVFAHLQRFKPKAQKRSDKGEQWWELRACDYYDAFSRPKILIPAFAMTPRFAMDSGEYFFLGPAYFIASDDLYLLAVLNSKVAFDLLLEICSVLGDQDMKGRAVLRPVYFENLPIPAAPEAKREAIARLAQEAQRLHMQRRERVEQFLRDIGTPPGQSGSRNPLERPWTLTLDKFARRARTAPLRLFTAARDETAELTEQIARVEHEIDERVAGLYDV